MEGSDDVVSDNVELLETSEETLGGGDIVDITETEDVGVLHMSQGFSVDGEHEVGIGVDQTSINEVLVGLGGWDDVKVVVPFALFFTGLEVSESGSLGGLVDLNQVPVVVDVNTSTLDLILDELISLFKVLGEDGVGIHDGERVLG